MRIFSLLCIFICLFFCSSGCGDEGLKGPRVLPVYFNIANSIPEAHRETVIESGQRWEEFVGYQLFVFEVVNSDLPRAADGLNVILMGDITAGALAQTVTDYISGELDTDIVISDTYDFANFDFFSTIAHELGNALQLTDVDQQGAIMDGDLDAGEKHSFMSADKEEFNRRYQKD